VHACTDAVFASLTLLTAHVHICFLEGTPVAAVAQHMHQHCVYCRCSCILQLGSAACHFAKLLSVLTSDTTVESFVTAF
jgi:hypothetical protein